MPTILIPKETLTGETRVAAVPETVTKLVKAGLHVLVEAGAGAAASIPDEAFRAAGATVGDDVAALYAAADIVARLNPPQPRSGVPAHESELPRPGALLISFLWPFENQSAVRLLVERRVTAFAMDLLPRISRAQKMDALSSQANIAGYKAVLMAANTLPKMLPLMMTPAGTITPSKVMVMGAGVAGLQAIATAKRLGAVVEATDVRAAVKEQVESLGAKFVGLPPEPGMEDAGGYAKEQGEDFLRRQQELVRKHVVAADVVITTALIPGRPAPRLVTADMVREMSPGSVIVDLAAERGGNCELTHPGETIVESGVTIIGHRNLPALTPWVSSLMYARNILHCVTHLLKEGAVHLDFEDEIIRGAVVTHGGQVKHPKVGELLSLQGATDV